jgi:hypothetical protein
MIELGIRVSLIAVIVVIAVTLLNVSASVASDLTARNAARSVACMIMRHRAPRLLIIRKLHSRGNHLPQAT